MNPIATNIVTQEAFTTIFKYGIFVIMCIYIIFAFIMTRQLRLMNRSFETPLAKPLKFIGGVHLLASIFVALLAFIVL